MTDDRERWALILGASSGMGEATALAPWRRPATTSAASTSTSGPRSQHVEEVKAGSRPPGSRGPVHQHERRRRREAGRGPRALDERFDALPGGRAGALRPRRDALAGLRLASSRSSPTTPRTRVDRKKMEMTQDVMANSLVYWVQDLWRRRVPRAGLQDLRDDLGGFDAGSSRPTASCRRPRPRSRATSASWPWSSPDRVPA